MREWFHDIIKWGTCCWTPSVPHHNGPVPLCNGGRAVWVCDAAGMKASEARLACGCVCVWPEVDMTS